MQLGARAKKAGSPQRAQRAGRDTQREIMQGTSGAPKPVFSGEAHSADRRWRQSGVSVDGFFVDDVAAMSSPLRCSSSGPLEFVPPETTADPLQQALADVTHRAVGLAIPAHRAAFQGVNILVALFVDVGNLVGKLGEDVRHRRQPILSLAASGSTLKARSPTRPAPQTRAAHQRRSRGPRVMPGRGHHAAHTSLPARCTAL